VVVLTSDHGEEFFEPGRFDAAPATLSGPDALALRALGYLPSD
jgi:hypothetical protein